MRIKIILISVLSILFIAIITFSLNVSALEIDTNDFSSYLNCYKGDIYTETTYIRPLTKTNYYNVGSECFEKYGAKEINAPTPKYKKIGYKVNGEFYMSAYHLTENGAYKIEVFFYEQNSDGYYFPHGSPLESFYIYVNLDFKLEQTKTNFYYEYYENVEKFIEDVSKSFSEEIILPNNSISALKASFVEYNNEKKVIGILAMFKNVSYSFSINLLPLSEIKDTFHDLNTVIEDARIGQAFAYTNSISDSLYINDVLEGKIINNIASKLKLADGQKCDINIASDIRTKSFGSSTFQTYSIPIVVSEVNTNEEIYFSLPVLIYKPNYVSNKEDFMKISFLSNEYIENQAFINPYNTYLEFEEKGTKYRDYNNAPVVSKWKLDTNKNILLYNLKLNVLEKTYTENITIIKEESIPKILTKYNYIVLPKKESIDFQDQIKIICNIPYNVYYDVFDIEGEDWLSIEVVSSENNQQIVSKKLKISYKPQEPKGFLYFLFKYGQFLRKIFS